MRFGYGFDEHLNEKQKVRIVTIMSVIAGVLGVWMLINTVVTGENTLTLSSSMAATKFSEEPFWFLCGVFFQALFALMCWLGVFVFGRQWRFHRLRERAMQGHAPTPKQGVNLNHLHFDK